MCEHWEQRKLSNVTGRAGGVKRLILRALSPFKDDMSKAVTRRISSAHSTVHVVLLRAERPRFLGLPPCDLFAYHVHVLQSVDVCRSHSLTLIPLLYSPPVSSICVMAL